MPDFKENPTAASKAYLHYEFRDMKVPTHLRTNGAPPRGVSMNSSRVRSSPPPKEEAEDLTLKAQRRHNLLNAKPPASRLRQPGSALPKLDRQRCRGDGEASPPPPMTTQQRALTILQANPGQGRGELLLRLGLPDDPRTRRDLSNTLTALRRQGRITCRDGYWYPAKSTQETTTP